MPVTIDWGNPEQTFTVMTVSGRFEMQEVVDGVDRIKSLMDTVNHKVDVVVDLSDNPSIPSRMVAGFPQVASRMGHPNSSGTMVIVGAQSHMQMMLNIFSRVFRKLHYVDTLQEAEAYFAVQRVV